MKATCHLCGIETEVTPTGRTIWSSQKPQQFRAKCPWVRDQIRDHGIFGAKVDCPHIKEAEAASFAKWRRDNT